MKFVNPDNGKKKVSIAKIFVSQRAKLLAGIKKKEKRRDERPVEIEEEDIQEEIVEKKGPSKQVLSLEEIDELKAKTKGDKDKKSSRDITKDKIEALETQISKTKYNKKTQHAIGLMKAQIATLKTKLAGGAGKGGVQKDGYAVKKSGDGTVVLLGFPSTGKSTLLNKITGAISEVGAYAFTTLTVIPGMLNYKHAKIQILDVPGIVEGAAAGSGRGKEVLQVVRNADLIVILIDGTKMSQYKLILKEVYDTHVRINQKRPDVKIHKQPKDGIRIGRTVATPDLDDETVRGIMNMFRIINAEILIREEIGPDQLIDLLEQNKAYIPAITIVSKADLITPEDKKIIDKEINPDLYISAHANFNMDKLKDLVFDKLDFIRIYLKEVGYPADMKEPMIMIKGSTIRILCDKLHKDFVEKFKFAKIWGPSAKFDGQVFMKQLHTLKDEDVVELHIR
jgi:small GTP-binding protein